MANVNLAAFKWLARINPINSTIVGTRYADVLAAAAERDAVFGMDGNDALSTGFNRTGLVGGKGHDRLTTDILVLASSSDPVEGLAIQYGGKGRDKLDSTVTLQSDGPPDSSQQFSAENLLSGGSDADTIKAVANVAATIFGNVTLKNHVLGGSGNDAIDVLADARGAIRDNLAKNCVDGGSGKDEITARAETEHHAMVATAINVLKGGSGDDILDASAIGRANGTELVRNSLSGEEGNDTLRAFGYTNSNSSSPVGLNELWGGSGNDTLDVRHEDNGNWFVDITSRLYGGSGGDDLKAEMISTSVGSTATALQHLDGGDGWDMLEARMSVHARGGAGLFDIANVLKGGDGNDRLEAYLEVSLDNAAENASSLAQNRLDGGARDDTLIATVAAGSVGASILKGGSGNDRLIVIDGTDNELYGGVGRDTLASGAGSDHMDGGADADRFVFAPQNGHDTVVFEKGADRIDLKGYAGSGIHGFADLDIDLVGDDSVIRFDADNDITVAGVANLAADDFLFA
ncbi:hypothetical protein OCK02_17690 [Rhizobium sp. TRM96647]|uniref:calcium-binding protein n=1 Tax=unclassified Rhizobium TaxID=2613769 RepID=UPI0021E7AFD5|nr:MULTISPECIES: calcium-binding protein [unclassified Rhizobium]MCV3738039.1 hypothetical protein [Rhizobium sp. TRM96647]MCV3759726.1 hypothetical protein [Rhizobium sp. TRM96650]